MNDNFLNELFSLKYGQTNCAITTYTPFVFATNKYNERDDQIEAEYLYNQISEVSKNHSCNGNIKRFSEDFEVLCKSYTVCQIESDNLIFQS